MWNIGRLKPRGRSPKPGRRRTSPQGLGLDWLLEERCLLNGNPPILFPTTPAPTQSKSDVLYDGVTGSFQKTITITNNSPDQTIYAFLEGELTRMAESPYDGTSAFDPFDSADHEYRGYIGYTDGTNNYAGLPPQSTITITVPLAFWDSARINFSTDGASQFTTYSPTSPAGSPFYYLSEDTQAAFFASIDPTDKTKLNFTPIYNSFDPSNGYMPSTKGWQSPIASGLFQGGQVYEVSGPGIAGGKAQVTIDANNPGFVTLPALGSITSPANQKYVFTIKSAPSIAPTKHYFESNFPMTGPAGQTTDGVVMWYHSLQGLSPANDAPFQLFEATFRGTFYDATQNPTARFQPLIGDAYAGSIIDSADYDLSFVDSINLPIAIQARNVLVPYANVQAPFGWVGSSQTLDAFQKALQAFASTSAAGTNTNFLGTYFGGRGYPTYLSVPGGNLKLPSGQNIFLASPLVNGQADFLYNKSFPDGSQISQNLYALSTGTPGPILLSLGGDIQLPNQGNNLALNTSKQADQYALNELILAGVANGATYNAYYGNTLAGRVTGPYVLNGQVIGVTLDRPIPPNAGNLVYTFSQPQTDYASAAIAGLWYSWAKYYADQPWTAAPDLAGSLNGNIVTLQTANRNVVPGMTVTGDGVFPGTVVLSVGSDGKTVRLSALPAGNPTGFSFAAPAFSSIVGYDPTNTPLVNLTFSTPKEQKAALDFAQTVFTIMSAWSVSVPAGTANAWSPLLANIIGGNLNSKYIPHGNIDIVNTLTVLSKSALRGVPDYTSPLYANQALWYPDPALPAGGLTYNAFNLDPYVWFIHKKLGLTAYAFSLDDDIGNVQGGGANILDISVGGLNGLSNRDPYTATAQWGVVQSGAVAHPFSSQFVNPTNASTVGQVVPFDYNQNQAGTIVNGPGVPVGTSVQFLSINSQDPTRNTITLSAPLTSVSNNVQYSFFGTMTFTGTVLGPGQDSTTILLDSPDAYTTLMKIGPLQNVQVTGEGIDPANPLGIDAITQDSQTGVVTVKLHGSIDPAKVSLQGSFYAYSFGSALVPTVRDPGFEWVNVQNSNGNQQYNHGAPLSAIVPDWTFTDSKTNTNWYAGIAYSNTSIYTQGNTLVPQGLQVGFVQGDSSISQQITLAAGNYTLKFQAGLAANYPAGQSLLVTVGSIVVANLTPTGTAYAPSSYKFTVPAAGTYLLKFAGTQATASTVLLDAIEVQAGTSVGSEPQRLPTTAVFVTQPAGTTAWAPLEPVSVAVFDRSGRPWSGVRVRVSLVRIGGSRGHLVRGSVVNAATVDGVATFGRLAISAPGRYVLRVLAGRQRLYSDAFDVAPGSFTRPVLVGRPHPVGRAVALHASPGAFRPARDRA